MRDLVPGPGMELGFRALGDAQCLSHWNTREVL